MRGLRIAALAVSLGLVAFAQSVPPKEPVSYARTSRASRVEARPPGIRLGLSWPHEFAMSPLSESEKAQLAKPSTRLRTGVHRSLPSTALTQGAWQTTSDGGQVWRLALRSSGSLGVRVEFRNFSVGAGKVWLHDGTESVGPYTGRGPYDDGHFWSAPIESEAAVIEYVPDGSAGAVTALPFEVIGLSHQARRPQVTPTSTTEGPDFCQLDVNCYAEWKPAAKMVGMFVFEDGGDQYECTGSLIATRDNSMKPYLLTAGHCINNEAAARTVQMYWTYQTSSCGGAAPVLSSSEKSPSGAHLISYGTIEQGDYSLLLLQDIPSDVTFSGWDTSDPALTSDVAGVHHPAASWKRISFGQRVDDAAADVEGHIAPASEYLQIQWNQGVAQPGSSGSPLFTSPGVIVGTLTYGSEAPPLTACEIIPNVVGYARFSNAYRNLQAYLEDWPAATVTPAPSALSFSIVNHATPAAQTVQLTSQTTGQVAFKIRSDAPWIVVSTANGQISSTVPAALKVSVDPSQLPQSGQYTATVTILAGTASPVFVNVTATVQLSQSNITATVDPATIVAPNAVWPFRMLLSESAGVATRITAVKINGTDYSANIVKWFGTDQIAAMGTVQASLTASGVPAGPQYFEFWGTDPVSGQQWYRVASALFK